MPRTFKNLHALSVATLTLLSLSFAHAQSASNPAPNSAPKTTDQAFKNIRVLKGLPSDQLIPAMQFIAGSLGVECEFCHVQGAFEKDDKETKQTARKMIQMMTVINQDNFDGHREVTCFTCHRGNPKPLAIPLVAEAKASGVQENPEQTSSAIKLPAPQTLIDKYLQAIGGADRLQKITSRLEKGTMNAGGHQMPIEIYAKAPDKRASIMHMPDGSDSITAFDGHSGWLGNLGHPAREMRDADIAAARLDADLYFPAHITQIFSELKTDGIEKVEDQSTYEVTGTRNGQPPVHLYFDQQTGLLLRMVRYIDSPLGLNPTQIDYADYRDSGGVKIPYRWTLGRTSGSFTIQVQDVQTNVPIDDAKFAKPADPAPSAPPK